MSKRVEFRLVGEALPTDAVPSEYEVTESISAPYEAHVFFTTKDAAFKPLAALRTSMTLIVEDTDRGRERSLTGICDTCELVHHDGTQFSFRVRLMPPIAALAHREDCRIYQDKSVVDIAKEVLAAAGVDKAEWHLVVDYPKREYVVQYRETELDFLHRLLEDEGIFYFYSHAGGEATMVFADSTEAISEKLAVPAVLGLSAGLGSTDPLSSLSLTKSARTSVVHMRDFDFEKPQILPDSAKDAATTIPQPYYEYPGGFTKAVDGDRRVTARLRSRRGDAEVVLGSTTASNLEVGKMVAVIGAAQDVLNRNYVVLELRSRGRQSLTGTGTSGDASNDVTSEFRGIPEGAPWAPARKTRKPRIHGLQTAMVTGPTMGEEEIHTEKYARVKVRFRWDRVGQFDDRSSCWLRVMQSPLGGQIIIPRVGWEVSVGFLEGDPDKPFVIGRIYNAERTPPYALPANRTSGSLRSASSPGGAGFNELRAGDAGGGQGFNITAQKDLNLIVKHDESEKIGVDDTTTIKVNASQTIGANQSHSVGGNQTTSVGSVDSTRIGGNLSITVGGNAVDNTTSNYVEKVGGNRDDAVGSNMLVICNGVMHDVAGNTSRSVGAAMLSASVAKNSLEIGGNYRESIGAAKVDICKGPWNETVKGMRSLTLLADLHLVKGNYAESAGGSFTNLIGGLHYEKVAGDFTIKAPMVTLVGGIGDFKGGGSQLKMGGGPIVAKGSKVALESALVVHLGSSMKMGQ